MPATKKHGNQAACQDGKNSLRRGKAPPSDPTSTSRPAGVFYLLKYNIIPETATPFIGRVESR
jgi:hypothetical protein